MNAAIVGFEHPYVDANDKRAHKVHVRTKMGLKVMWNIPEDVPLFQMKTAARAADVPPATMRAWHQRKHIRLSETDSRAAINGLPNKFTLRSVLMLAVTGELVRLGSTPGDAFKCAEHWMRTGVVEGQVGAITRREAGGLFAMPYMTYLVAGPAGGLSDGSGLPCRIEGIDPNDPRAHSAFFNALFLRGRSSAKIVFLNLIDRRVRQVCYEATLGDAAPAEPDWEALVAKIVTGDA